MKIREIPGSFWETSDGRRFWTKKEAEDHVLEVAVDEARTKSVQRAYELLEKLMDGVECGRDAARRICLHSDEISDLLEAHIGAWHKVRLGEEEEEKGGTHEYDLGDGWVATTEGGRLSAGEVERVAALVRGYVWSKRDAKSLVLFASGTLDGDRTVRVRLDKGEETP